MNIHSCLSYYALPFRSSCFEKVTVCVIKTAHDVDIFPDEIITKRSQPTNQAQTKINNVKGLKTSNDLTNYLITYKGLKIHVVILKILDKY